MYASGGNKCGQLGVNNEKLEGCDKFRKCTVVDYGGEEEDGVKIIHVSIALRYTDLLKIKFLSCAHKLFVVCDVHIQINYICRPPVVKTSRPSSHPKAISTLLARLNGDKSAMEKPVNTLYLQAN